MIRQHSTTPIAIGEVFNSVYDYTTLNTEQLIDYVRMPLVHGGGITHLLKVAALASVYHVQTGFHGATDLSPVNFAASLHFDLAINNFGVQEYMPHVEPAHIRALCIAASDGQAAISLADGIGSPPTLFPAGTARDALRACERPVRQSLSNAVGVAAAAGSLADYDAPEDFGRRSAADRGCPLAAGFDVDQGSNPAKG